jgi:hypothetical protein
VSGHRGWSRYRCSGANTPGPHEHGAVSVDSELLDLSELVLEIFEERLVEGKLTLEGTVGHPTVLLQHRNRLAEDVVECHDGSSVCGLPHDEAQMPLCYQNTGESSRDDILRMSAIVGMR